MPDSFQLTSVTAAQGSVGSTDCTADYISVPNTRVIDTTLAVPALVPGPRRHCGTVLTNIGGLVVTGVVTCKLDEFR